jgi:outer membrane receptor for ferrienterochelin and colicin
MIRYMRFFLLCSILLTPLSYAQQSTDDREKTPDIQIFEVVTVTAEADKLESPTTISEVTLEQLQARDAKNIGEALELLPGVQFRLARSKNEQQVTVRGFEQEKVLILMDGIPISIPYEGQMNLQDIPVQNIEKIELIKGVSSSLYGANDMGGVINIITKQGKEKAQFSAQYEGSQYATHDVQVGHGWKVGPFGYYAAFSHQESNGYPLPGTFTLPEEVTDSMAASPSNPPDIPNEPIAPDSGSRDNGDYARNAVTVTGTLDINSKNTLGVSFEHYDHHYGAPPVPIYREHRRGFFYFPRYWRFTDWNRTTVNVIEESRLSENFTVKGRFFYDKYDNLLNIYDNSTYSTQDRLGPPSGSSLYDDYDSGFSIYGYWRGIPGSELRASLNFRRDVHRDTFAGGPTDRLSSDTWSIGVEDEIKIGDRLSITPGISFDFLDKRERFQSSENLPPGENVFSVSPQVGLRFDASERVSIYGSVGRKTRFPTMRNLYADGVVGPIGNPDLEEESAIKVEVGSDVIVSPKFHLGGAFFYSRVTNMINFDNLIGRFEQYPKASMKGFELTSSIYITSATEGYISYTYLRSRALDSVTIENQYFPSLTYSPDELPYRPEHQIDLEIKHKFDFGLDAAFNGMYVSEATYYDHADPEDNTILVSTKGKLADYFIANIKLSQKIVGGFRLYFAIENLGNTEYQTLYLYPSPGRTYKGGLRFEM